MMFAKNPTEVYPRVLVKELFDYYNIESNEINIGILKITVPFEFDTGSVDTDANENYIFTCAFSRIIVYNPSDIISIVADNGENKLLDANENNLIG